MGNFSRNTFDPQKNYVGVRLQQGVPILDADWNELNDVTRQELYDTISLTFTDGVRAGSSDFAVQPAIPAGNNFLVFPGTALIGGRPVRLSQTLRYTSQPWFDKQRADKDGVAVIPPLTIPTDPANTRTDLVYLDVWEREIDSTEDTNLINHAIGVETSVRLKREVAVRVAEGTPLPPAPAGHAFLPIAVIKRVINQTAIQADQIEDKRPLFHSQPGTGVASFFPAFLPISTAFGATTNQPAWRIHSNHSVRPLGVVDRRDYHAFKTTEEVAVGVLPLVLPDGAILSKLHIKGQMLGINGVLQCTLLRLDYSNPSTPAEFPTFLSSATILAPSEEVQVIDIDVDITTSAASIVDNSRYSYLLHANTSAKKPLSNVEPPFTVSIYGVAISYSYSSRVIPPQS